MDVSDSISIREAELSDHDDIIEFTKDIWDGDAEDYLPEIFPDWIQVKGDEKKRTLVAVADETVVGIVQGILLSNSEAWFQGMRVHPKYQRSGIGKRLTASVCHWAASEGATIGRIMVLGWNMDGLAATRNFGFEPIAEARWAIPVEEDTNTEEVEITDTTTPHSRNTNTTKLWEYWQSTDECQQLDGLFLSPEESWALRSLIREDIENSTEFPSAFGIEREGEITGMVVRSRHSMRTDEEAAEATTTIEYGVMCWERVEDAEALLHEIRVDAVERNADHVRVLIPESPRSITDMAANGVSVSDYSMFIHQIALPDAIPTHH